MSEFKFYCPQCGQHILCDTGHSGMQINCPVCQQVIVVPQAPVVVPVPSPPPALQQRTPLVGGCQNPVNPVAQRAIPMNSRPLQTVLFIVAASIILAGLGVGGWIGYSKIMIRNQIRHMPSGLVGLWSGDGSDTMGGDNASMTDIALANGKVGKAFYFNGSSSSIKIPASPRLDVGAGVGFTVMAWINPTDVTRDQPLFEWSDLNYWGVHFHISSGQPTYGSSGPGGPGQLYANIVDSNGGWHQIGSAAGVVTPHVFQLVALSYDKVSGAATIYCNGQSVSQQSMGSFNTRTAMRDLYLGRRPAPSGEVSTFSGLMDGVAVFNRALSAEEIQAIYTAQK